MTVRVGGTSYGSGFSTWNIAKVEEVVFEAQGVRVVYAQDGQNQAAGTTFLPYVNLMAIAWTKGE